MNRLTTALAEICRAHLLTEKWLLVPSYRVGQQWIDAVARAGQPVVNVRLHTTNSLAFALTGTRLAEAGTQPISPLGRVVLVGRLLSELRRQPVAPTRSRGSHEEGTDSYLGSIPPSLAFAEQLAGTLRDLRLAGVTPAELEQGRFEAALKGRELIGLLRAYLAALQEAKRVDEAELLERAVATGKHDVWLLVPEDLELAALERRLVESFPAARRQLLPVDPPSTRRVTDLFRAVGEINELREVLRRCVAKGWPLDQVELITTDPATYESRLYELTENLPARGAVTFADGIPVRYSRPGRALAAWLAWTREDLPQTILAAMIQDGLLDTAALGDLSAARIAGVLRSVPIGFGRARYAANLAEALAGLEKQLADLDARTGDDDERDVTAQRAHLERRLAVLRLLPAWIDRLLPGAELLPAALTFLREQIRCITELDQYARQVLVERVTEMMELGGEEAGSRPVATSARRVESVSPEPVPGESARWRSRLHGPKTTWLDPADWLEELLSNTNVLGQGPRPGCLHVASLRQGGHSERAHTFIVGLDSGRFPPAGGQDPVLLDGERQALSAHLRTSGQDRDRTVQEFDRLLARLRGDITLSYPSQSLAEDGETFPSQAMLAAFRVFAGLPEAGERELVRAVPAVAFAPADTAGCLDETEWWFGRLCAGAPVQDPTAVVAARFPHLGRGWEARRLRATEVFGAYDGFVPDAAAEFDPARSFSPSRLETLGTCPRRFFYKYVLGAEPPDELELDPARWLPPAEFGHLLHDVLFRFMKEIMAAGQPVTRDRDEPRLRAILRERIAHYREKFPPPSEGVFRRQCRELERALRIFLVEEEAWSATSKPLALEKTIPAVPIVLPGGETLPVTGRIDRVDETALGLVLWDYKSGGTTRFRQTHKDPFRQGRLLQHALYLAMAEQYFGRPVAQFGYFFPSEKGRGERLTFAPAQLRNAPEVLARLRRLLVTGVFPATDTSADCAFCDYQGVCGDVEAVTQASERKCALALNKVLAPFRELRGYE